MEEERARGVLVTVAEDGLVVETVVVGMAGAMAGAEMVEVEVAVAATEVVKVAEERGVEARVPFQVGRVGEKVGAEKVVVAREEEGRVVEATEGAVMAAARVAEAREVVGEVPCRVDREVVMVVERVGGVGEVATAEEKVEEAAAEGWVAKEVAKEVEVKVEVQAAVTVGAARAVARVAVKVVVAMEEATVEAWAGAPAVEEKEAEQEAERGVAEKEEEQGAASEVVVTVVDAVEVVMEVGVTAVAGMAMVVGQVVAVATAVARWAGEEEKEAAAEDSDLVDTGRPISR